ncbi:hypothetical protein [Pseudoroseicyclus tamaricis]|uniref:Uncharacterized protein n=1 Tax=Pseudoroseicyclus tamaricis TaxID=2705421 RepID=A0A6B2JWN9_9RHOB|nr:hypothetical protein [Pseudoroseicyclus tamaricis]NDU99781.1 hypothetical protein [Pseudoroseicyclus tamaricis]
MADDKTRETEAPSTGGPGGASPTPEQTGERPPASPEPRGPAATPAGPAAAPAGIGREAEHEVDAQIAREQATPSYTPDPTGAAARGDLGSAAADPTPGAHGTAPESTGRSTGLIWGIVALALVVIVALVVLF